MRGGIVSDKRCFADSAAAAFSAIECGDVNIEMRDSGRSWAEVWAADVLSRLEDKDERASSRDVTIKFEDDCARGNETVDGACEVIVG